MTHLANKARGLRRTKIDNWRPSICIVVFILPLNKKYTYQDKTHVTTKANTILPNHYSHKWSKSGCNVKIEDNLLSCAMQIKYAIDNPCYFVLNVLKHWIWLAFNNQNYTMMLQNNYKRNFNVYLFDIL